MGRRSERIRDGYEEDSKPPARESTAQTGSRTDVRPVKRSIQSPSTESVRQSELKKIRNGSSDSPPRPTRTRMAFAEFSDSDNERPVKPPTRTLSDHSKARGRHGSLASVQSYGDSVGKDAGSSTLDLVLAKRYAVSRDTGVEEQFDRQALLPPSPQQTKSRNRVILEADKGLMIEDVAKQYLDVGKERQDLFRSQNGTRIRISENIPTDGLPRTDSLSTVPDPPSLYEGGYYSAPGAFRMRSGEISRATDDSASLVSSVRSYISSRGRHPYDPSTMVEASLVHYETVPDDECPPPPPPATFAVSMSDATQMTAITYFTTTTASPIVEALPLDESQNVRAFFRTRKVRCFICLLLSLFVVLALGTAYGVKVSSVVGDSSSNSTEMANNNTDSSFPTNAPTSEGDLNLEYFVDFAIPDYTRAALRRQNSPQNKAFRWLRNNTMLDSYSLSQRLQRFALATFFFATGGDRRWTNNAGWMSDSDECSWFFATDETQGQVQPCDENKVLRRLSLAENNMRGTFPMEISMLSSLEVLEMPRNVLTGFLPTTLGGMRFLRTIHLFDNYLSGTIPRELGFASRLETIDVEFNFLVQILPDTLGKLANLKKLLLDRNLVRGSFPTEFGRLSHLETFYLYSNSLSGTIPPELGNLSNLKEIRWEMNRLSGALPSEVGLWTKAVGFTVGNNTLSGTLPSEIGAMSQLTYLDVFQNFMTGTLPTELGLLTSADRMYFDQNLYQGEIPTELGNLHESLTRIWLFSNDLTGSLPSEFGLLTKLTNLDTSFNKLSGLFPTEIGLLRDMEYLSIEYNDFRGPIPSELGQLSALSVLALHGNQFTGTLPEEICQLKVTGNLSNVVVDCSQVLCGCCICGSNLL